MVSGFAKTPRFVLKDGSHPTCPTVSQSRRSAGAIVTLGFSGKLEYDLFLSASFLAFTPYRIDVLRKRPQKGRSSS